MSFQGSHYTATYSVGGVSKSIEVYGKDEADAKAKVLMIYPTATSIVIATPA